MISMLIVLIAREGGREGGGRGGREGLCRTFERTLGASIIIIIDLDPVVNQEGYIRLLADYSLLGLQTENV